MFRRLRSDRAGTVRATARARPTGWGDAIIIIPYQMYMQYGNKAVLTENYETMCNWMEYLVSTSENYIRDESWTGDWLPVGEPKSPIALTDTAFCAYSASLLAEISAILGKTDKAAEYRALYENYRTAWRAKFLTGGEGGQTICGTQTLVCPRHQIRPFR